MQSWCRSQEDRLHATPENSDSGWVTTSGVGAFQLRIGQPAGSKDPLVGLAQLFHVTSPSCLKERVKKLLADLERSVLLTSTVQVLQ